MKNQASIHQKLLKKYQKQKSKVARLKKKNHQLTESIWVLSCKLTKAEQDLATTVELYENSADHIMHLNLQINALNIKLRELGVIDERTDDEIIQDFVKNARQKRDEASKLRAMQHTQDMSANDEETSL